MQDKIDKFEQLLRATVKLLEDHYRYYECMAERGYQPYALMKQIKTELDRERTP